MTAQDSAATSPERQSLLRRAIAAAAIGNMTEWYDFGVYSYVATYVGAAFFPSENPSLQTLQTFGVFAVSFLLRPLGSFFFGPLGDRIGRQRVLAITILLMAGSTFLLGLVPSYDSIGILAPVLLLLCRMLQGFSTGGEYGGAATYIAEFAPNDRRGFYGSWLEFGTLTGFGLGASVPTVLILTLDDASMHAWGWRIAFLIAGPLGAIGLYLRRKLEDTPAFRELQETHALANSPVKSLVAEHWRRLLILMGVVLIINVANYTLLTYLESYLKNTLEFDATYALLPIIGMIVMMLVLITPIGRLSDKIGRKPLFLSACLCFIVLSYPAFLLLSQGTTLSILAGLALLGISQVQLLAPLAATLPAMFPTKVRYAAFCIGYNVSTAVFGGTAPFVNDGVVQATGNAFFPAYYLIGAAAIALVPVLLMKETAGSSLTEDKPSPGTTATASTT